MGMELYLKLVTDRPSHLQTPGGPEMACATLLRRALDGKFSVM